MAEIYDVVVVGAGPGGSAAAYELARQGLDVLLLDKAEFPRDKTCGDALTPRALAVLEEMALLGALNSRGYRTAGFEITAPNGRAVAAPIPRMGRLPTWAMVLPRMVLDDAVRQLAIEGGARFQGRVRIENVESETGGVVVSGQQGGRPATFRGRTAVVATGASVKLLVRMGVLPETPPMMVAARAYFEGVEGLSDRISLRFDGVPLPGYGWLFPLSETSANVGAGVWPSPWPWKAAMPSARHAYDAFVRSPAVGRMLARARQVGPLKGFPLRADFASAPTYSQRVLLVGEAAGLVNPLTGEGVDYALESGRIAGQHLGSLFGRGDFSRAAFAAYDRLLRERYQALFRFCTRVQRLCLNRPCLNLLVRLAGHREDLRTLLAGIVLGDEALSGSRSRTHLRKAILARNF